VPTFAFFRFYNITNPDTVNGGGVPVLSEVGPYTCLTAPPIMTARISRTSSTAPDSSVETMTYTEALQCDTVQGRRDDIVYLYDKSDLLVHGHAVSKWVENLKGSILSDGDTVGAGGSRGYMSYESHGNTSIPNNYMRRVDDDSPVLPIFPHARLADGDVYLTSSITSDTTLQWHISSIGATVSFSWDYALYVWEPIQERPLYARFSAYLPHVDLTSRGSALFDDAYAYHNCVPPGSSGVELVEMDSGYPGCASPSGEEPLSEDDFYLDINLLLGIPAPIKDLNGAGDWQAWQIPAFSSLAGDAPNCTGNYADANVSPNLWAFGFWSGVMPYVCNTKAGYDPLGVENGVPSQWLAEYGVMHGDRLLPAFAFSMMPKMLALVSPSGLGSSFPGFYMGETGNALHALADTYGLPTPTSRSSYMEGYGNDMLFAVTFYSYGVYMTHFALGLYVIVFAFFPTLLVAAYRLKADAS